MAPTPAQVETLRRYLDRANHGRGRITGESRKLLRAGYLRLQRTSMYCWVLTITDAGRAAIK